MMRCDDLEIWRELKAALHERRRAVLVTVIETESEEALGAKALFLPEAGRLVATGGYPRAWLDWTRAQCAGLLSGVLAPGTRRSRIEVQRPPLEPAARVALELFGPGPRLVIAGAGHIAQAVHTFAAQIGFAVTVIDDRPAYANRERFPLAAEVICDGFAEGVARARVDAETCVVVVTRGHRHDVQALAAVAPRRPRYVGVIGSKRRVIAVTGKLREMGVAEEFIDGLYAPVGLDIGAESPEEIGLAVVAEVLCVTRGRGGGSLRWRPATGG